MAATKTSEPALKLAMDIIGTTQTDPRAALVKAERAALKFPDFRIPAQEGQPSPTFGEVAEWLRSKVQAPAPESQTPPAVAEPTKTVPAPKKTAARKAAPKKAVPVVEPVTAPEPVKVVTATLKLVHDGVRQTSIYGVEKDSAAHRAIGRKSNGGLGWAYYADGDCWYLYRTQGYAPDMARISEAVTALESIREEGVQLYRVETDIREVDAEGKALPVRMTRAQAAAWQREYDGARNALHWNLSMEQATCGKCGATGLNETTGRMGKNAAGMPMVECWTCGGFAAPVPVAVPEPAVAPVTVDLSTMLALPSVATPLPESAECPSCHQPVPVKDGKLALHTGKFGNGACRGRLGVVPTDVEAEPAAQPARKTAARKAAPVTEPTAAPEQVDASSLVVRFALQAGLSGSARNATASEVRSALSRKITYGKAFRGVKIETRRDKENHRLVMTVTEGGEGYDAAELADAIGEAVKSVRGVGNRIHKA